MNIAAIGSKLNTVDLLTNVDAHKFVRKNPRLHLLDFKVKRSLKDYNDFLTHMKGIDFNPDSNALGDRLFVQISDDLKQNFETVLAKRNALVSKLCAKKSVNKITQKATQNVDDVFLKDTFALKKEIREANFDTENSVFEKVFEFLSDNGFNGFVDEVKSIQAKFVN